MSPYPWTDGSRELIQHTIDHLALGGDFDRRIAMISVDNAVELTLWPATACLTLPRKVDTQRRVSTLTRGGVHGQESQSHPADVHAPVRSGNRP
jgi:hypothetical protein